MDERIYTLGFAVFPGIGTKRFAALVATCGSAKEAWEAEESVLVSILGKVLTKKFMQFRASFDVASYAKNIQEKSIDFVVPSDDLYPPLLKQLAYPPFILFTKGNVALLQNKRTIGIVGTRKVTSYGEQVTTLFTRDLVQQGFTIVSGMALGVDGIAHNTCLDSDGTTIAVLGSGVDVPTPREHVHLYQDILAHNGLIVSTFAPGEDASKGSFPARNAIVAGLSRGILVTEGAKDSGSLITASFAKEFGRPVFAVPGQITSPLAAGTNNLIKSGAIAVSSASDIIENLEGVVPGVVRNTDKILNQVQDDNKKKGATQDEQNILDALRNGPLLFDEIARTIGKDSKSLGTLLSMMELKGLIKTTQDGKYSI